MTVDAYTGFQFIFMGHLTVFFIGIMKVKFLLENPPEPILETGSPGLGNMN